jgi:ribosomal protein S14
MSNKFLQVSDFYKRLLLVNKTKKNYINSSLKNDCYLPKHISYLLKNKHPTTYIKNRCVLTGRSRAVSKQFKLNRMPLKNLILHGFISGVTKYSW